MQAIVEDVLERWFTPRFREAHPGQVAAFREGILATPSDSYLLTSGAICGLDLREELGSIETPSLVISGSEDRATPPAWGRAIAEAVPGAIHRELKAAHLSNVERSVEFNEELEEFLAAAP